jgi:hypothetical protein
MEFKDADAGETGDTVLELLDRVLNTGVVLAGEIAITVADIELIYLRLQLLLSSAETARQAGWLSPEPHFGKLSRKASEGWAPTRTVGWDKAALAAAGPP